MYEVQWEGRTYQKTFQLVLCVQSLAMTDVIFKFSLRKDASLGHAVA
jgi:hypothetical protein